MIQIKLFIYIVITTVFFIAANIVGGIANAAHENEFNLNILRDSLIKYGLILLVAALMYGGGYFGDEVLGDFVTDWLNVKNLVALGLATYAANRAADATKNWVALTEIKSTQEE